MARDLRQVAATGASPSDFVEAKRITAGTGYSMAQMATFAVEYLRISKAEKSSPTATFSEGAKLYLDRAITKNRRPATIKGYKANLVVLNRTFGSRVASTITESEVRNYVDSMRSHKGVVGAASPYSRRGALRFIKGVMRILGTENPLPGIPMPESGDHEVRYFTVAQVQAMFQCTRPSERGALALLVFAALRPTLVERLSPASVDSQRRTLHISHNIAKDRRSHVLETEGKRPGGHWMTGLPKVLWKWLEKYPFQPVKWAPFQKRLRKALKGFWIHDGTRHTGATYYSSLYGEKAASDLLTHESPMMAVKHYIGIAYREDAMKFYAITPDAVKSSGYKKVGMSPEWPPNAELARMLREKPATVVAQQLGCSGNAITKHCRRRSIPKYGRGDWVKIRYGHAGDVENVA